MKRREFVTSLAVLGCTAIVPLPKTPIPTARVYQPLIDNSSRMDLTPEMLDRFFEYYAKETIEHIRFCYERDKGMMDLLDKLKEKK